MIADIANNNTDTADVFFLIAVIVFAVAALAYFIPVRHIVDDSRRVIPFGNVLVAVGLACVALAFLVL